MSKFTKATIITVYESEISYKWNLWDSVIMNVMKERKAQLDSDVIAGGGYAVTAASTNDNTCEKKEETKVQLNSDVLTSWDVWYCYVRKYTPMVLWEDFQTSSD